MNGFCSDGDTERVLVSLGVMLAHVLCGHAVLHIPMCQETFERFSSEFSTARAVDFLLLSQYC